MGKGSDAADNRGNIWLFKGENAKDIAISALAEFVAHTLFIYVACGAAATTSAFNSTGATQVLVGLVFGFSITSLVFAVGHVSGAHINWAVTFGLFTSGNVSGARCVAYFFAHVLGGCVGAALLYGLVPESIAGCYAANMPNPDAHLAQVVLAEFVGTFLLLFVVTAAYDKLRANDAQVPISIGMAVGVAHFLLVPLSGTSINPTRSLASAIASTAVTGCEAAWPNYWIFVVGPLAGGVAGSLVYEVALAPKEKQL